MKTPIIIIQGDNNEFRTPKQWLINALPRFTTSILLSPNKKVLVRGEPNNFIRYATLTNGSKTTRDYLSRVVIRVPSNASNDNHARLEHLAEITRDDQQQCGPILDFLSRVKRAPRNSPIMVIDLLEHSLDPNCTLVLSSQQSDELMKYFPDAPHLNADHFLSTTKIDIADLDAVIALRDKPGHAAFLKRYLSGPGVFDDATFEEEKRAYDQLLTNNANNKHEWLRDVVSFLVDELIGQVPLFRTAVQNLKKKRLEKRAALRYPAQSWLQKG